MIYFDDYTLLKETNKHLAGFTQKWEQVRILVEKKGSIVSFTENVRMIFFSYW